jgi:hypothetical protein
MKEFLNDCKFWVGIPALVVIFAAWLSDTEPYYAPNYDAVQDFSAFLGIAAIGVGGLALTFFIYRHFIQSNLNTVVSGNKAKQASKQIAEYQGLLDTGVITEDQFEAKKRELQEWVMK